MKLITTLALIGLGIAAEAQQVLTIDECREMALKNNHEIKAAQSKTKGAEYTKKSYKANYLPSLTLNVIGAYSTFKSEQDINVPVIGELPGTRVELKTSTKILTYDHVVIEAEAGKNPTVVKVTCKSTDKPPKNNAEYLKSEAVYTSKKPAGYEWMDANHPDQVITPQDYKTETIEKVS